MDDGFKKFMEELSEDSRRVAEESRRAQEKLERELDWTLERQRARAERRDAEERRRAADELERQAIQAPTESRPESPPAKTMRTRNDGMKVAIKAAEEALQGKMQRRPTADEVFHYLADRDETGIIVDSTSEKLVWQDSRGELQDTGRATLANRLSRYRR